MISRNNDREMRDINTIRESAVEKIFRKSICKKVLILTEEFPFIVIGQIKKVEGDYVFVDVETTHIDPLENRIFRIHLDRIEVFYIEKPGRPIPKIPKYDGCRTKVGDE